MAKPWQPQVNCYKFEEEIVNRIVPNVAGVYGLHTNDRQLFIGKTKDLCAILLLHCEESKKLFRGLQPTHFSFEVCPVSACAKRAQELTAAYPPAITPAQLLSFATLLRTESRPRLAALLMMKDKPATDTVPQWPQAATDSPAPARPGYYSRGQLATLALTYLVTTLALGYFGFVSGQKIAEKRTVAFQTAASRQPVPAQTPSEQAPAEAASVTAAAKEPTNAAASAVVNDTPPMQIAAAPAPETAAIKAVANQDPKKNPVKAAQASKAEASEAAKPALTKEPLANPWTVQIYAAKDQKAAEVMQDKLKNKGFDAFIVEAEVNAAQWYRVRVGRFNSSKEAEAMREALQAKENLQSAFVTAK